MADIFGEAKKKQVKKQPAIFIKKNLIDDSFITTTKYILIELQILSI